MTTLAGVQLSSPYHPTLALNRGGFPEGLACHHLSPIRYIVRRASHPVISATVARLRRVRQEHAGYSRYQPEYTQLCDIVSHPNVALCCGRPRRKGAAPPRPQRAGRQNQRGVGRFCTGRTHIMPQISAEMLSPDRTQLRPACPRVAPTTRCPPPSATGLLAQDRTWPGRARPKGSSPRCS